jgi:hypothetical protein
MYRPAPDPGFWLGLAFGIVVSGAMWGVLWAVLWTGGVAP